MNKDDAAQEMRRMDLIVNAAHAKHHNGRVMLDRDNGWNTPLEELIEREDQARADAEARTLVVFKMVEQRLELTAEARELIRTEVWDQFCQYENCLMEWIFSAGPHPLEVLRRLFAYAKMKRPGLLWNMGFRAIGPLLKETHAAAQARCRALFGSLSACWSKPSQSVERMRAAQRGNLNRLGGKKVTGLRSNIDQRNKK
ncbi:MAG: hypothetical protein ACFUZC_16495 [Chthoniobacteraceae bacterium]